MENLKLARGRLFRICSHVRANRRSPTNQCRRSRALSARRSEKAARRGMFVKIFSAWPLLKPIPQELSHLTNSFAQLKQAQAKFLSCIDSAKEVKAENKSKYGLNP